MTLNDQYLIFRCEKGLEKLGKLNDKVYLDRLKTEFDVITSMKFTDYFLVVAQYVNWAKENGCSVGPGRGSAVASLVGYLLGITELDPVVWRLPFERFLNPDRVSAPDYDIDFSKRDREKVIDYVKSAFGEEYTCQIGTVGTMKARLAVRKASKAMGLDIETVNRYSKLIPEEARGGVGDKKVTLVKVLAEHEDMLKNYASEVKSFRKAYDTDLKFQDIVNRAVEIEGVPSSFGIHAAGVIIGHDVLAKHLPLMRAKDKEDGTVRIVTQWDKKQVEALGFIKFDFLGLKTLDIISDTIASVQRRTGRLIKFSEVGGDDPLTFELLRRGDTSEVFQFDSKGMQELCRNYKPVNLYDISVVTALFRPGPLDSGMCEQIVKARNGEEEPHYYHERLKSILEPTLGALVFQEQTMELAKEMAGYTMAGADLLRRAMGHKDAAEMATHFDKFVNGAMANGFTRELAERVFNDINGFAAYGFNLGHSAGYAVISYRTAYLKAHYPADYYASVLTNHYGLIDKIPATLADAERRGIKILPPDVNESLDSFAAVGDKTIRLGLNAIRGCGEAALMDIVTTRGDKPYKTIVDFCDRVSSNLTKKNNIRALASVGVFDSLLPDLNRLEIVDYAEKVVTIRRNDNGKKDVSQLNFFDSLYSDVDSGVCISKTRVDYNKQVVLDLEKEVLGFYISGSPLDQYSILSNLTEVVEIKDLTEPDEYVNILAQVVDVRRFSNKRGDFLFVEFEDRTGKITGKLWSESCERYEYLLKKGSVLFLAGKTNLFREIELVVNYISLPEVQIQQLLNSVVLKNLDFGLIDSIIKLGEGKIPIDYQVGNSKYRLGFYKIDCLFLERFKEYLLDVS